MLVSESIRDKVVDNWNLGLFSVDQLKRMTAGKSHNQAATIVFASVPVANAWSVIQQKANAWSVIQQKANAWSVIQQKAKEGSFRFKAPRVGARNPKNEADELEREILDYFAQNPAATEYRYNDESAQVTRYFRPVRLQKQCELCHGDPATSLQIWGNNRGQDLLGYPMENSHAGQLQGAFEIITPYTVDADILSQKIWSAVGFLLLSLIIIGGTGYFVMNKIIISPLTDLALNLQNIAGSEGNLRARLKVEGKS